MTQTLDDKLDTLKQLAQPAVRASMGEADWRATIEHTMVYIKALIEDNSSERNLDHALVHSA